MRTPRKSDEVSAAFSTPITLARLVLFRLVGFGTPAIRRLEKWYVVAQEAQDTYARGRSASTDFKPSLTRAEAAIRLRSAPLGEAVGTSDHARQRFAADEYGIS